MYDEKKIHCSSYIFLFGSRVHTLKTAVLGRERKLIFLNCLSTTYSTKDLYEYTKFIDDVDLPRHSGSWLVGTTCPFWHVAAFPPRLMYPPGQLRVRVVPCATGSAGTVTILLHVDSRVAQL